jgi:hypothetical protein
LKISSFFFYPHHFSIDYDMIFNLFMNTLAEQLIQKLSCNGIAFELRYVSHFSISGGTFPLWTRLHEMAYSPKQNVPHDGTGKNAAEHADAFVAAHFSESVRGMLNVVALPGAAYFAPAFSLPVPDDLPAAKPPAFWSLTAC